MMKMNAHALCIDPGAEAGAALFGPDGKPIRHSQVRRSEASVRAKFVQDAVRLSVAGGTDLVIIREKWQAGGKRANPTMFAGLGAAWGQWLEELYLHAPFLPATRFHSVFPSTWRKGVIGASARDTDGWKRLVAQYVASRFSVVAGPDEGVALCLGVYTRLNAKIVASVQEQPRWHSKALVHTTGVQTAFDDEVGLRQRIIELEAKLAKRALADSDLDSDECGV